MSSARRKLSKPRRCIEAQQQPVPEQQAHALRLLHFPEQGHPADDYSDLVDANEIPPYLPKWIYQGMERHLPPALRGAQRGEKLAFMQRILAGNAPSPENFARMERYLQDRQRICSLYKPLHPQLYRMNPYAFFLPSFLRAIRGNTIQSLYDIIHEPAPKVYTFPMLRPAFCQMLMNEVENFQKWAHREKQEIYDPSTLDKPRCGTAISDIGMKEMLDDLMKQFISPFSKVLFPEVGGGYLDSQHSYVVSNCRHASGLGMHVEDYEITLTVCLGGQFTGGEYFNGRRCGKHVNSGIPEQDGFLYSHVAGKALLYHGRQRHNSCASSGFRVNLIMWCRSSLFKEVTKCKIDFPDWCGECLSENIARRQNIPIP